MQLVDKSACIDDPARCTLAGVACEPLDIAAQDMDDVLIESVQAARCESEVDISRLVIIVGCDLVHVLEERAGTAHRDEDGQRVVSGMGFGGVRHHSILGWTREGIVLQHLFVEPLGQDDNLGDSVLRAAYMDALRGSGRRLHVQVEGQSSDYLSGLPLKADDVIYSSRKAWLSASASASRPVMVFNAGEWTMRAPGRFPNAQRVAELQRAIKRGGAVIAAGLGVQSPAVASSVDFAPVLLESAVVSWRDEPSRDAAGFGTFAPDWAFGLGTPVAEWCPRKERGLLAVTLRFDRAWPDESWLHAVKTLATVTATRIVTVAQVARDAPRAVRLAEELGGEYLGAESTSHADLDAHVRSVYSRCLAVVSDRAHALILGATEGAYPIGSAADPQKISRMLDVAHIAELTGSYDALPGLVDGLDAALPRLGPNVALARRQVAALTERIHEALIAAS